MSVLRNIEHKIEGLFEGVFGRAFRTHVQPVELARKLVKEMEDHRVISVSRVYAPNEYSVYLAPTDREQFANYEDSLRSELQQYLAENARRERYELLSEPIVKFEIDEFHRHCLLNGLDDIALTMVKADKIENYEHDVEAKRPWS